MTLEDALGRLRNELRSLPDRVGDSVARSFADLGPQILSFVNPINRLRESFQKAERSQARAAAMGTTVAKFQQENTTALSKLLGGQNELIQVLMDFRQSGLRRTGDELNKLAVRMRYTGQNTGALVEQMSRLSVYTGDNTQVLESFAKQNSELSRTYKVTNESLIQAINALDDTLRQQSILTGSTNIGRVAAQLTAMAPQAKGEIMKAISQLMDPKNLRLKVLTGTQGLSSRIASAASDKEAARMMIEAFRTASRSGKSFVGGLGMSDADQFAAMSILEKTLGFDLFASVENLSQVNWDEIEKKFKIMEPEDNLITAKQQLDASKKFYDYSVNTFYPTMIQLLRVIAIGGLGAGAATGLSRSIRNSRFMRSARSGPATTPLTEAQRLFNSALNPGSPLAYTPQIVGAAGGALGRGLVGGLGRVLGFLGGPWGIAISTIAMFIPDILSWFTKDSKEDSENLKISAKALTEINDRGKGQPKTNIPTLEVFIAEQVRKTMDIRHSSKDENSELNLRLLELSKELRKITGRIQTTSIFKRG